MEITVTSPDAGGKRLAVEGDVDVYTADEFRRVIAESETSTPLTINLSQVSFMDSTGLGVLIGALTRSRETGSRLILEALSPRVDRLLSLTGIAEQFEITE
ncbi:MAG: anti-sigma factor antagonist [Actinobacteria bacterium]|nr:anti-sigma factor antagonist [Actinomycetota bacterium]